MSHNESLRIVLLKANTAEFESVLPWMIDHYGKAVREELNHSNARLYRSIDENKSHQIQSVLGNLILNEDQCCLFVGYRDDKPVGYFLGLVKDCIGETPDKVGYVNGLYVDENYRSHGYGQLLLNEGNAWFRSKGLSLVELYVAKENRGGKAFWNRNGYFTTDEVMLCQL